MFSVTERRVLRMGRLLPLLLASCALAQTAAKPAPKPVLEITVEKKTGNTIEALSAEHVFETGDVIRFRLQSDYTGYLYVMDQGSSGRFTMVFPAADTGSDNHIQKGAQYLVPATGEEGWFAVGGPAGFDVLYFLLSPDSITPPAAASFAAPGPVSSLKPRCNDAMFRARGECMDITAGPAPVPAHAALPAPIAPLAGAASRDITVVKKKDSTTVSTSAGDSAPVIYTFRLAHH